ncbi:GNAT family N-acetyltransferase [uncultured Algibacter sp.]|uniref:GNAT family N-acetyltransferase n=1 Tax=uncultured Algibacter sp. TaxID=298659 RepID=UPI00261ED784|nr:GNAT family N-acetyltransferase [uncultured Algibacter sp.]
MHGIIYKRATTHNELHQILELQQANIINSISEKEKLSEGFVTVNHSFETLNAMNNACSHIIAKQNSEVVGYVLSMVSKFKDTIEVLVPMFKEIDKYLNNEYSYLVMGQICVDKIFRKQGLFRGLYNYMRQELNSNYDVLITEVDTKNIRSLNAHKAVGFQVLKSYKSNNHDWELLIWNWK